MSQDTNHVILIGRCTRDAALTYTPGGMAVCKFSIAVNKRRKQGEQWVDEANYFDIVAWGKTGESINEYLVKGKQVAVEGELHQNRWEQDGQNRSKVEINANNVQLLGGGENRAESTGNGSGATPYQKRSHDASATPSRSAQGGSALPDDVPEDWTF